MPVKGFNILNGIFQKQVAAYHKKQRYAHAEKLIEKAQYIPEWFAVVWRSNIIITDNMKPNNHYGGKNPDIVKIIVAADVCAGGGFSGNNWGTDKKTPFEYFSYTILA